MNGVNVRMIISFDVKIVRIEVKIYKYKNNLNWLAPAFLQTILAICLKKPTSSKNIERIVIDMNKHKILRGLIASSDVKPLITLDNDTREVKIIRSAPTSATTQYVPIPKFLILILGKNRIEVIRVIQVIIEIKIVSTITITKQDKIIALTT